MKTIHSLQDLSQALGDRTSKLGCYCVSSDHENEYAIVLSFGSSDALEVLEENQVYWGGSGVNVNRVQRNVVGQRELIWLGKRALK